MNSGLGGSLSSLASQFGGLASLAGLSATGDSKKSEFVAYLRSEAITTAYIRENNLLPVLYAKVWNAQEGKWKNVDPDDRPTLWKASQYFREKVRDVELDAKTGLVTVTVTWKDPQLAAQWANGLVKLTNDYLRSRAIAESDRNIDYLNQEAAKTNIVEAKQAIYAILRNEINSAMLARGNEEYAFKIIDAATVPERKASPKPLLWIVVGFVIGCVCAVLFLLIRNSVRPLTSDSSGAGA
jgi:LPS O-antigen subunit length determinant protein (WzzB/FepE family)